ncbi:MAG TPA: potassium channel family protein [Acidimicrobiia bacterium]|nr:potassium channel family protein [Acidimicrobiia bacterium]
MSTEADFLTPETADYMTPRLAAWRKWTDLPLLILAIGSLPLLLLELIRDDLIVLDREFLDIANLVVLVAFATDYFVELLVCANRRSYVRHEWTSALIVVTQALAVIPALSAFGVLRVLRAGRVLRFIVVVLRVVAIGGVSAREGRTVLRRHAAAFGLGLAGFTWILSAVLFTMVEDVGQGERVHSFFDALWWSLTTITTVGYGDVFPVTAAGRIIGGFTMVVGISTFALVTAKFAEFLVRSDREDELADDNRTGSAAQGSPDGQLNGVVELLSEVQREFADRDRTIEALRQEVEHLRARSA